MSNVIRLPLQEPAAPAARAGVMDETFVARLAAANATTRKLREMGIHVSRAVIRGGGECPVLTLHIANGHSIAPLLDATEGRRHWLHADRNAPPRAIAALGGCTLKWEMPTSPASGARP